MKLIFKNWISYLIIYLLLLCFLLFLCFACSSNNNYLEGNTQLRVEYYEDMETNTCRPDLKCKIRNNAKCVTILYNEVKKAAKKGLEAIENRDFSSAAFEFSFALCNVISIDKIFERMESDNYREWKAFKKDGTIEHIRMVGIKLSLLIAECEDLARNVK